MRCLLIWCLLAMPAWAGGDRAGVFDYYVLSLSWSPNWCALEGRARRSEQCDKSADFGWVLHGLWPQYATGYPSYCPTAARPPSRAMTAAMADVTGTAGLAWHQWKKHGACSGLSAEDYFALSRRALDRIVQPAAFRRLERPVRLPAHLVEDAFLRANPGLGPDGITVTCANGYIQEVRLCLTRDLDPVACGPDIRRDCSLDNALFEPVP